MGGGNEDSLKRTVELIYYFCLTSEGEKTVCYYTRETVFIDNDFSAMQLILGNKFHRGQMRLLTD